MAYVIVEDFRLGLDRRGSQINGTPGSCWTLTNAHLNRKGEIERMKKFVAKYTLPAGTFGLHAVNGVLTVFGSAVAPVMPSGVSYQRLQHPDGATAMAAALTSESFDGKIYAIAEYTDDRVCHFYDGALVADWLNGVVRSDMTDNDGIATHLTALIDADADYAATCTGSVITVTGPVGEAFTVETVAENGGTTDDQTAVAATTQTAVAGSEETLSTASFRIVQGSTNAGVNTISSVKVNGVAVINAAVNWTTSNGITAANLAQAINTYTSSPDYTASATADTVTISAVAGTGTTPNTFDLEVDTTGDVVVSNGSFKITGGTASAGVNKVTNVMVGGVDILGAAVDWTTSNAATATAVAAQINAYTSTPEYGAAAVDNTVFIGKRASLSSNTAAAMTVGVAGNVTTSTIVAVSPTATQMSGGVAAVAGQAQISTVTIGGTFDPGDHFTIRLIGAGNVTKRFGAEGNPETPGRTALTFKGKLYSTVASLLHFSGYNNATAWNNENIDSPGANYINMASQDQGSQDLTALGSYEGQLAVFSEEAIQLWQMEADEDANTYLQTLQSTGTKSPESVLAYGNNDVFYLATSGFRSLRARSGVNAAYVSDVGTPIDPLVKAYMKTLTAGQITAACAMLEPDDERYWCALGSRVFVFSFFPGSKISAWSYYEPGFEITAFARMNGRIYARSGDTIYLYGGDDGDEYPADNEFPATVVLPFLSAGTPGTQKTLSGFDVALEGEWKVDILVDPNNDAASVNVGTINKTTYPWPRVVSCENVTHFAPKLVCNRAGYAKISNMCIHYADPNEAG